MNNEKIEQNLIDAGCTKEIIEKFFACERMNCKSGLSVLNCRRLELLNEMHAVQNKLDCLDYLIYKLKDNKK